MSCMNPVKPTPPLTPPPKTDGTIRTCVHKHDENIVVQFYYPDNIRRFPQNGITQYQIIDLDGNEVFWNINEIENYNCSDNEEIS
jgi:hypothetical protein